MWSRDPGALEDFGRLVTTRPEGVARPGSIDELIATVRAARREKLRLAPRGQAHTTRGQSQRDGGLVIDLRALDAIGAPEPGRIRVGAGARWKDVLRATVAEGQTPPVLTDFIDLTVGGTISVGGVGGQSYRHGLQVDNVLELAVVTGAGELVRCSREHEPDLFDACRGGLGQGGLIAEATLQLVPAPRQVRQGHLACPDLDGFLARQHELARQGAHDYLLGNLLLEGGRWRFAIEHVDYLFDDAPAGPDVMGFLDYANRLEAAAAAWRRSGSWDGFHPWVDLFVPAEAAGSLIASTLEWLDAELLGEGYVMTYPLLGEALSAPLPGVPDTAELFLFDVLPGLLRGQPGLAQRFETKALALVETALSRGATVYPIGYPIGTPLWRAEDVRRQAGPRWAAMEAACRTHDPDGLLRRFTDWHAAP